MTEGESDLFRVSLNEEGIKYIRKFAALSYVMLVLVIFQASISIYWGVRMIIRTATTLSNLAGFKLTMYDKAFPYFSMLFAIVGVVANIYYLKFPRSLLRSIEVKDEYGANKAFRLLLRGAFIFFLYLVVSTFTTIWSMFR